MRSFGSDRFVGLMKPSERASALERHRSESCEADGDLEPAANVEFADMRQ